MKKQISYKIVSVVFCALVLCFAVVFYALGWTEPTVVPPGGNVSAPLNVGGNPQIKTGALQVNGFRNIGFTVLDTAVSIGGTDPGSYFLRVLGTNDVSFERTTGSMGLELRSRGGGTPFIDFSNDATSDYDMRLILTNNNVLTVDALNGNGDICTDSGKCLSSSASGISCDWVGWKGSMTFTVHEGSKYPATYSTMILNCAGGQVIEMKYLSCTAANAAPYNAGIDCSD